MSGNFNRSGPWQPCNMHYGYVHVGACTRAYACMCRYGGYIYACNACQINCICIVVYAHDICSILILILMMYFLIFHCICICGNILPLLCINVVHIFENEICISKLNLCTFHHITCNLSQLFPRPLLVVASTTAVHLKPQGKSPCMNILLYWQLRWGVHHNSMSQLWY